VYTPIHLEDICRLLASRGEMANTDVAENAVAIWIDVRIIKARTGLMGTFRYFLP